MKLRPVALLLHRYVGLAMTVFLVVAGLTGSVIAFQHELDAVLNPELRLAPPPSEGAVRLEPLALRSSLMAELPPGAEANSLFLQQEEGRAARFFVAPPEGAPSVDDEYFVDPYTGKILGSRKWGAITQGKKNLIPFIYRLHYSLALGEVGLWVFGFVALLWTFDCFAGAYLTFPARGNDARRTRNSKASYLGQGSWLRRWGRAWLLKTGKMFSLVFTWHRASGLWVWAMLLVFAWSGVALNLHEQVYRPVMEAVVPMEQSGYFALDELPEPRPKAGLSWPEAYERGQFLMAQLAQQEGFEVLEPERLRYYPNLGHFQYRAKSSLDITTHYAQTAVWFDGISGDLATTEVPTGRAMGNTITTWLFALHFGNWKAGGLPYRIFVSVFGVLVAVLSITGAWIWWRKRKKKSARGRSWDTGPRDLWRSDDPQHTGLESVTHRENTHAE